MNRDEISESRRKKGGKEKNKERDGEVEKGITDDKEQRGKRKKG